MSDNDIN